MTAPADDDEIDPRPTNACLIAAARADAVRLDGLGRIAATQRLVPPQGSACFDAMALERDGRWGFLRAPAFEAADCAGRAACERLREHAAAHAAALAAMPWFDTLVALQDHVCDAFAQAPAPHFHLDGWSRFVEQVLALGGHPEGATAAACLPPGDAGRWLSALGTPLLHIAGPATPQASGETLAVVARDDRIGLLLLRPGPAAGPMTGSADDDDAVRRRLVRAVRWFESLDELQAHVFDDFDRERGDDAGLAVRPSWRRLKAGVRRLVRSTAAGTPPDPASARARHVFPERLVRQARRRTWWSDHDSDWRTLLWDFGDVVLLDRDDGYRGDARAVLRRRGRFGFVVLGWGSCRFCDALKQCRSFRELEGVMRLVEEGIRWFDTLAALQLYVADDAERRCSHAFHNPCWPRFRAAVLALTDATVGDGDLHFEVRRARELFPDAVSRRSNGDPRWDGAHAPLRLLGAFGQVLLEGWFGGEDDAYHTGALLYGKAGYALVLLPCSVTPHEDTLGCCRHYGEIEALLRSLEARLAWHRSLAGVLTELAETDVPPGLSAEGEARWNAFVEEVRGLARPA